MKQINSLSEYHTALEETSLVIDLYADWCAPCKKLLPSLENLADDYPSILFVKLNIDQLEQLEIPLTEPETIPCIVVIKGGLEKGRISSTSIEKIEDMIQTYLF
jgi:thiol-disulfide isomerase/thioredoxin